jgi:hypothetical protein
VPALLTAMCFNLLLVPSVSSPTGTRSMPRPVRHVVSMRNAMALARGPSDGEYATNWSGYVDTGGTFSDVSGSWIQPAVSCRAGKVGFAAFWVGIDGFTTPPAEQAGTEVWCKGQQTTYEAVYELYPAAEVFLNSSTYPVLPGDTLTARVSAGTGSLFTISLSSSRGWDFTTTGSDPGALKSSAEWIAEAPWLCVVIQCFVSPLANFGTVDFTGASASSSASTGSISAYPYESIVMAKLKKKVTLIKADPSSLSPDGTSFSVRWAHS